ncbi:TetR/AcrR family transcriptional regulator [Amycolatopsis jejuensis]|uniref:TetR/AcrR family transcriptional regulator n=1 Tax=Amycolatopsis jejuensis TaxID=330084 RepID=UPI0005240F5F|nr:TetR/AcrR family transcriptional regulator [Amycolatopsis jejuensis]
MALTRTPPEAWIGEGLQALADGGPDAVRIEPLAQRLGVSKGGFYWHFTDRPTFLTAILDAWEKSATTDAIELVESADPDPRAKLRLLFSISSDDRLSRTDFAVRMWAQRDADVAERLRRVDRRRREYLRTLFATLYDSPEVVEAKVLLTSAVWIGSHLMTYEDYSRPEVVELALKQLVD